MVTCCPTIQAELFAQMPDALHHRGEPTAWVRAARPGQSLHSFLEGPCFDGAGQLMLVDVPYGRIFGVSPSGVWRLVHAYDGEPHGLIPAPGGGFVVADCREGLLRFDAAAGSMHALCTRVNTERFRGLSDLARAPNGDIWFTDPGRSSLSDPTGRLFRLATGALAPKLMLGNVPYPNGVALSPDGRFVYLAATRANAVWRLLADAPDPVFPMAGLFIQLSGGLGPDGLAVDRRGNLAVAQAQAGRAWLFDPMGDPLCQIRVRGGTWTTAVAFGPEERYLYIVESQHGAIHRADLVDIVQ